MAAVRPLWETLTQSQRDTLLTVSLDELRAYAKEVAARNRAAAEVDYAEALASGQLVITLEDSVDQVLEQGLGRTKERGSWKVWEWGPEREEFADSDAFRKYLEENLLSEELRGVLPKDATTPSNPSNVENSSADSQEEEDRDGDGAAATSPGAATVTNKVRPTERPSEAAFRQRLVDLMTRVQEQRAAQEDLLAAASRRSAAGRRQDPTLQMRDAAIDLIITMLDALQAEHEAIYNHCLFPITSFLCELLPEGKRKSTRTELYPEDLEKILPDDVHRIYEFLQEKVDALSSKLKPDAKDLEAEDPDEEPIGDVDLFSLTPDGTALHVNEKWLSHLRSRVLGEDSQPRRAGEGEDPTSAGLVLEWVYGTIVSTAEKGRDAAHRALGAKPPSAEEAVEALVVALEDLVAWEKHARSSRELMSQMLISRKEAAVLGEKYDLRTKVDQHGDDGGNSPEDEANTTSSSDAVTATMDKENSPTATATAKTTTTTVLPELPNDVIVFMLKREALLTAAKLHAITLEQLCSKRELRSYQTQIRTRETQFERLKKEIDELKATPSRSLDGSYRNNAEMERHRAQLADAAIEEQITAQSNFRRIGARLQRAFDQKQELEIRIHRSEQECSQLANWRRTMLGLVESIEDLLAAAAPLQGTMTEVDDLVVDEEVGEIDAAKRALVAAVRSATHHADELEALRANFHTSIRRQLYLPADDLVIFEAVKKQLKDIETRLEEGRVAVQHLLSFAVNVSCDDPGLVIGTMLLLPFLQERLDLKGLEWADQKAAAAQNEVIMMEMMSEDKQRQEKEKKAKAKAKAKEKARYEKEKERQDREERERKAREAEDDARRRAESEAEEARKRKVEELEALRKAEEELMEQRRRELLASEDSYWRTRVEQEELLAVQAELEQEIVRQAKAEVEGGKGSGGGENAGVKKDATKKNKKKKNNNNNKDTSTKEEEEATSTTTNEISATTTTTTPVVHSTPPLTAAAKERAEGDATPTTVSAEDAIDTSTTATSSTGTTAVTEDLAPPSPDRVEASIASSSDNLASQIQQHPGILAPMATATATTTTSTSVSSAPHSPLRPILPPAHVMVGLPPPHVHPHLHPHPHPMHMPFNPMQPLPPPPPHGMPMPMGMPPLPLAPPPPPPPLPPTHSRASSMSGDDCTQSPTTLAAHAAAMGAYAAAPPPPHPPTQQGLRPPPPPAAHRLPPPPLFAPPPFMMQHHPSARAPPPPPPPPPPPSSSSASSASVSASSLSYHHQYHMEAGVVPPPPPSHVASLRTRAGSGGSANGLRQLSATAAPFVPRFMGPAPPTAPTVTAAATTTSAVEPVPGAETAVGEEENKVSSGSPRGILDSSTTTASVATAADADVAATAVTTTRTKSSTATTVDMAAAPSTSSMASSKAESTTSTSTETASDATTAATATDAKRVVDLSKLKSVRGLSNSPGVYNCFLNVIIQSLWHLTSFRRAILSTTDASTTTKGISGEVKNTRVLRSLYKIFEELNATAAVGDGEEGQAGDDEQQQTHSNRAPVSPQALREALDGSGFDHGDMHDAAEVLGELFDLLHAAEAAPGTYDPTLPRRVMVDARLLVHSHSTIATSSSSGTDSTAAPQKETASSGAGCGRASSVVDKTPPATVGSVWGNAAALQKVKESLLQQSTSKSGGSGSIPGSKPASVSGATGNSIATAIGGGGGAQGQVQAKKTSMVQRIFGMEVVTVAPEVRNAQASNSSGSGNGRRKNMTTSSTNKKKVEGLQFYKYFHLVPAQRLRLADKQLSFEGALVAACGEGKVTERLLSTPNVFTLSLVFESPQVPAPALAATLAALKPTLGVSQLFIRSGVETTDTNKDMQYHLRCMVCYSSSHYFAFALSEDVGQWLLLDDAHVSLVGQWSDVSAVAASRRLQPSLLFYERNAA